MKAAARSVLRTADCAPAIPTKGKAIEVLSALGPGIYAVRVRGVVKIGHTTDLAQRLHSLGSIDLLAFAPGMTFEDELDLHRSLRGHAVRGREWYPVDDPDVLAVVDNLRARLAA